MGNVFSKSWKKSTKPEKQRKYLYNAPYHLRGKFMSSPLSGDMKKKLGRSKVRVRSGDKVKILRGQFKGKEEKVESVDLGNYRVYIEKVEQVKKDGTKTYYPIHPSNLMITEANTEDKKRFKDKGSKKSDNQGGTNE